jgi:hypothetical protein
MQCVEIEEAEEGRWQQEEIGHSGTFPPVQGIASTFTTAGSA